MSETAETPVDPNALQKMLESSPLEWVTVSLPAVMSLKGGNAIPHACHQLSAQGYDVFQIVNGIAHNAIATPGSPAGEIPMWVIVGFRERKRA